MTGLSVTESCRVGAVIGPPCANQAPAAWPILLTFENTSRPFKRSGCMCRRPGRQSRPPSATMKCMPLYFFNFSSPLTSKARPFKNEGLELADHAAAWEEATTACGEKLRELDGSLRPGDGWNMEVTDANGKAIFALRFTTESSE